MAAPLPDNSALPDAVSSLSAPDSTSLDETDIWWGSYAGRAMLPSFLLCLFLTVLLLAGDLYLQTRRWRSDLISSAILGLAGALWLFEGTRWAYRMIAVNYRLTNRRLLCTRGFNLLDSSAVELARITEVSVVSGPLERLLRVGRICIQVQDENAPSLVLDGVFAPQHVARTIRRRVRQARANESFSGFSHNIDSENRR
jgi:membrane protein YdbS with pleckstrin-like domain